MASRKNAEAARKARVDAYAEHLDLSKTVQHAVDVAEKAATVFCSRNQGWALLPKDARTLADIVVGIRGIDD